jgi:hypothetical protein
MEVLFLVTTIAYLGFGFILYRVRWPHGIWPREQDPERERLLRVGRRRVLPAPTARREEW